MSAPKQILSAQLHQLRLQRLGVATRYRRFDRIKVMKSITLFVMFAFCFVVHTHAQSAAEAGVLQTQRDGCKAFEKGDTAALERLLTDDFTLTLSDGQVSTRANEIQELHSGKVHYDVFENLNMKVRLYGDDAAVVLGQTHVRGKSEGKDFDRTLQFTDTVVKRDGRWQIAASHASAPAK